MRQSKLIYSDSQVRLSLEACPADTPHGHGETEFVHEHEIIIPRHGAFVRHLGSESVFADPNTVLFWNPGEVYQVSHPVGGGDRSAVFQIGPDCVSLLLGSAAGGESRPRFPHSHRLVDSATYLTQWRLNQLQSCEMSMDSLAVQESVSVLLERILEFAGAPEFLPWNSPTIRTHQRAVRSAREFIASRFRQRISLDEIASATALSKYHFCRVFRFEVGLPVYRYVNRWRLRAGLESLLDPRIDLSRLAFSLGFSSHSHFASAFRREFGLTPSQARRRPNPRTLRELAEALKPQQC